MDASMVNLDREDLCYADADHLADLWNAAYPLMREFLTARIIQLRQDVERKSWEVETLPYYYREGEAQVRQRLDSVERLRLKLGQLDRGEHRPCTQSPKCFSITAAHSGVTAALKAASGGQEGMPPVYRLAAFLAEEHDRWLIRMRERSN